ncbi:MAG: hypothetical protein CMN72_02835 [Sphingomonas sp.]|nr:hypothetical protein [Sphingomonas sp.]
MEYFVSDDTHKLYFTGRARLERDLALKSTNNIAAIRHFELAEYYDAQAKGDMPLPEHTVDRRPAEPREDYIRELVDRGTFEPFIY